MNDRYLLFVAMNLICHGLYYIHVYINIYIYAFIYIYIHTYTYIHIHIFISYAQHNTRNTCVDDPCAISSDIFIFCLEQNTWLEFIAKDIIANDHQLRCHPELRYLPNAFLFTGMVLYKVPF